MRRFVDHFTLATIRAGSLLALGAIHLRAHGNAFTERDALLTRGASACLARGQASGLGNGIRAEEPFGAALAAIQAARPGTPLPITATAQPLRSAGICFVPGKRDAALP